MSLTTKVTTIATCDWCGNTVQLDYDGVPSQWQRDIHFAGPGDLFCNQFDCRNEAELFWNNAEKKAEEIVTGLYFEAREEAVSKAKAIAEAEDGVHEGAIG